MKSKIFYVRPFTQTPVGRHVPYARKRLSIRLPLPIGLSMKDITFIHELTPIRQRMRTFVSTVAARRGAYKDKTVYSSKEERKQTAGKPA